MAEDFHWDARETSYLIDADSPAPEVLGEIPARLTLIGVLSDQPARRVLIAIYDSITDGNGAPMDAMARWPDFLARSLERDALAVPGADTLVLLIGTNDIAWPGSPFAPQEGPMTLDRLQAGLLQVASRTHAQGMRLIVGTLPPFEGALPGTPMEETYWSPDKDALRRELNDWLRAADFHDGLVDFDRRLAAPGNDIRLNPTHDSGDHLHPGAEGNSAMARAVADTIMKGLDQ